MALSTEQVYSRYFFERANKDTPEAKKVQKYLQEIHKVNTPTDFASKLVLAHYEFRTSPFYMSLQLVDAIVEACNHWKDYVMELDTLICNEVLSMARIHTSVIHEYFLRKHGFTLKQKPSLFRETTVRENGEICFCNR